jgi:ABC-2 type transport system ATP-binding protein
MADEGMAVLMTTHLLEEAEKADRVVIMSQGQVIACGPPEQLRAEMGEGIITIVTNEVETVERCLVERFGLAPQRVHHQLRLHAESPAALVPVLAETLGDRAQSITLGRPSLEDVFIAKTGLEFAA